MVFDLVEQTAVDWVDRKADDLAVRWAVLKVAVKADLTEIRMADNLAAHSAVKLGYSVDLRAGL